MKLLLFIGALACLHLVCSQCTRETLNNGTLVGLILANSLVAGTQSTPPILTVTDQTIVCLAVSSIIGQYRFASVVVEYNCTGTCPGDTTSGVLSQVEFGCNNNNNNNAWSEAVAGTAEGNVATPPAMATLQTELRSDCQTCLNPDREQNAEDELNHCIPCSGCLPPDQGLNMCTGSGASQCCNVNTGGQCRQSCLPGAITDPTDPDFICRASCSDPLPTELYQTGVLDDSNCTYAGCNATYTCDEGLTLSDLTSTSYQLRCLAVSSTSASWDVNTRTCSQRCNFVHDDDARASGVMIEYDPPGCDSTFGTLECVANYTHNSTSASCNCTRNDTTGLIRCNSDEVISLIMTVPTPLPDTTPTTTTPLPTTNTAGPTDGDGIPTYVIVVPVVLGVLFLIVILVMIGITWYCCCSKNRDKKNTFELNKQDEHKLDSS